MKLDIIVWVNQKIFLVGIVSNQNGSEKFRFSYATEIPKFTIESINYKIDHKICNKFGLPDFFRFHIKA